VFIPRPETEVLVEEALAALAGNAAAPADGADTVFVVVDLCTGSGAVAVSIAHECAAARVYATDLSEVAVEVAGDNAERCGVSERVTVLEGDLFEPLPGELRGTVDLVVANPPYVPSGDLADLPEEVAAHEPRAALDGGPDGLDVVRRIASGAREWLRTGGSLIIETDTSRAKDAAEVMAAWYEDSVVVTDLAGRDRVVAGRLRGSADDSTA
jgi:release factor glutamine methyltransferase